MIIIIASKATRSIFETAHPSHQMHSPSSFSLSRNNNSNGVLDDIRSRGSHGFHKLIPAAFSGAWTSKASRVRIARQIPRILRQGYKRYAIRPQNRNLAIVTMHASLVISLLGVVFSTVRGFLVNRLEDDVEIPMKHSLKFKSRNQLSYSLTLDPESNFQLYWTPEYEKRQVKFRVDIVQLNPQAWFALGFSDRGDWPGADLCVAWEDWKGGKIVQVAYRFLNIGLR